MACVRSLLLSLTLFLFLSFSAFLLLFLSFFLQISLCLSFISNFLLFLCLCAFLACASASHFYICTSRPCILLHPQNIYKPYPPPVSRPLTPHTPPLFPKTQNPGFSSSVQAAFQGQNARNNSANGYPFQSASLGVAQGFPPPPAHPAGMAGVPPSLGAPFTPAGARGSGHRRDDSVSSTTSSNAGGGVRVRFGDPGVGSEVCHGCRRWMPLAALRRWTSVFLSCGSNR